MRPQRTSTIQTEHLIWLCRRLSSALQADMPVLEALECVKEEAAPEVRELLKPMRANVGAGKFLSQGLAAAGAPAWVWRSLYAAETWAATAHGLDRIADELEAEASLPRSAASRLSVLGLTLARLGLMLDLKAPILTAFAAAAESVTDDGVRSEVLAAGSAVRAGVDLSDALMECCPSMPHAAIDMIRDAERASRLSAALPVIADYLLDVAGDEPPGRQRQEASNA
jgi:type II secretory pathway component PulF